MRIKKIKNCRICGNKDLKKILTLGKQPLSGTFLKKNQIAKFAPLDLVFCHGRKNCNLVQLHHSVDKNFLYGKNYGYRSGLNKIMVDHLKNKTILLRKIAKLTKGDTIIDVGSNDCTTLKFFDRNIYKLVGVDPTGVKFKNYYPKDIKLIDKFFSKKVLKNANVKLAKIIMSFAMYYDLEDPVRFAQEVEENLDENGIWCFEQSYLPLMIKQLAYDTVCHEHIEYYGLKQIKWILDRANFKIIDVKFNDINGGSFSVIAAKKSSNFKVFNKLSYYLNKEIKSGLTSLNYYKKFSKKVEKHKKNLIDLLKKIKNKNLKICALGASTKGNVILNYCDLNSNIIEEVGEVNNEKLGLFTPGSNIRITKESNCLKKKYDYYLILPWHFKKFFLKIKELKNKQLIFPLPEIKIYK